MSLPPATVKIRRKRNAEAPPDVLRKICSIQNHRLLLTLSPGVLEIGKTGKIGKKQRMGTDTFVFELQVEPDTNTTITRSNLLSARPIKPLHRSPSAQSLSAKTQQSTSQSTVSQIRNTADGGLSKEAGVGQTTQTISTGNASASANTGVSQKQPAQVRRFHISRTPASQDPLSGLGQARKRKIEPTIFVERKVRPKTPEDLHQQESTLPPVSQSATPTRPQKRPGKNARTPVPRIPDATPSKASPLPKQSTAVPSALRNRWDVSSDDLVAQMQEYTLQEIGYNLTESETTKANSGEASTPVINRFGSNKFKPTAPKLRYSQRHPEESKAAADEKMEVEYDSDVEMGSDEDYVVDTYIRVPVDTLQLTTSNIGLLVLDSEVDIEEFYRGDEESDEEDDLEDEDENGKLF